MRVILIILLRSPSRTSFVQSRLIMSWPHSLAIRLFRFTCCCSSPASAYPVGGRQPSGSEQHQMTTRNLRSEIRNPKSEIFPHRKKTCLDPPHPRPLPASALPSLSCGCSSALEQEGGGEVERGQLSHTPGFAPAAVSSAKSLSSSYDGTSVAILDFRRQLMFTLNGTEIPGSPLLLLARRTTAPDAGGGGFGAAAVASTAVEMPASSCARPGSRDPLTGVCPAAWVSPVLPASVSDAADAAAAVGAGAIDESCTDESWASAPSTGGSLKKASTWR